MKSLFSFLESSKWISDFQHSWFELFYNYYPNESFSSLISMSDSWILLYFAWVIHFLVILNWIMNYFSLAEPSSWVSMLYQLNISVYGWFLFYQDLLIRRCLTIICRFGSFLEYLNKVSFLLQLSWKTIWFPCRHQELCLSAFHREWSQEPKYHSSSYNGSYCRPKETCMMEIPHYTGSKAFSP